MSMLSDLKIERKLMAAFAVVILAIAAMGVTVFMQVDAMERARMDRARASAVQREAETAQFYLARQESSYRGFLLSHDGYYLERLTAHRENFNKSLDRMVQLDASTEGSARAARAAADEWTRNVVQAGSALAA
ncbi:MAG: CHASE3 domain-containing protein, partial [Brevundimonas sp.]